MDLSRLITALPLICLPTCLYAAVPPILLLLVYRWRRQLGRALITTVLGSIFLVSYTYSPYLITNEYWRGGFELMELYLCILPVARFPFADQQVAMSVGDGYSVAYVNSPCGDFYEDHLVITRSDGKVARIDLNQETDKCWEPTLAADRGRLYFGCGPTVYRGTYIDLERLTLVVPSCTSCIKEELAIADLEYK